MNRRARLGSSLAPFDTTTRRPQPVSGPHGVGQIQDACEHERHRGQPVGPMVRRLDERGFGVEAWPGEYRAAEGHGQDHHAEP